LLRYLYVENVDRFVVYQVVNSVIAKLEWIVSNVFCSSVMSNIS